MLAQWASRDNKFERLVPVLSQLALTVEGMRDITLPDFVKLFPGNDQLLATLFFTQVSPFSLISFFFILSLFLEVHL